MIFAGTMVRSPAPTLAAKWPRFVVPIIVPPRAMIPLMLWRSRMTWLPGGRSPSNPSRKPTTSQPCFSAASTTPRRTAFNPGQSPPLVRTPIRGFIFALARLEQFLGVGKAPGGSPLIVELPAPLHQSGPFTKAICAAEQHHDQMTREYCDHFALLEELWLPVCGQNQTVPRSS